MKTMRLTSILLLFYFTQLSAQITTNIRTSRTSGTAPLSVFFDATATTHSDTGIDIFHELDYSWTFGDAAAGEFELNNKSKNEAKGPVVAHLFETAGTYTVTVTVKDQDGTTSTKTATITVADPDVVYSGQNTICISRAGDFTGAPAGALQITSTDNTEITNRVASGKRVLLKRGEVWTETATVYINSASDFTLGAYGTGVNADAKGMFENAPELHFNISLSGRNITPSTDDIRIMDLKIRNANNSSIGFNGTANNVLLYQLDIQTTNGTGFSCVGSILDYWNRNGYPGHTTHAGTMVYECHLHDNTGGGGNNLAFMSGKNFAIIGSDFINSTNVEHVVRISLIQQGYINSNRFANPLSTKHCLKLHSDGWNNGGLTDFEYSEEVVISDNYFSANGTSWYIGLGPQNAGSDERLREFIFERNYIYADGNTATSQIGLLYWGTDVTIRNNIFDGSNRVGSGFSGISVGTRGIEPSPENVNIYNNTFYNNNTNEDYFTGIILQTPVSNARVINNLVYSVPINNLTAVNNSGTNVTLSNNLLTSTDCFASTTPSSTIDYKPKAETEPINAGITVKGVFDDFVGSERGNTVYDLGAYEADVVDGLKNQTIDKDSWFTIYPNPAFEKVTIQSSSMNEEKVKVKLHDISGKKIFEINDGNFSSGKMDLNIDLRKLKSGVYYLSIERGSVTETKKLMVL